MRYRVRWYAGLPAAIAAGVGLFAWGKAEDLTASDWAAWVSAIGSIVAIASGFALAWWQAHREHQRRDWEEGLVLLDAVESLQHAMRALDIGRAAMEGPSDELQRYTRDKFPSFKFPLILRSLELTNPVVMPGPAMRMAFLVGSAAVESGYAILANAIAAAHTAHWQEAQKTDIAKRMQEKIDEVRSAIQTLQARADEMRSWRA